MIIRTYQSSDLKILVKLFYDTVHFINSKDYSKEQVDVWASKTLDLIKWDQSLKEHYSLVALIDGKIVGFGDIDQTGYLDRLYVHYQYQGKGIAKAICTQLEKSVNCKITVHASITAKGFFEHRGYQVIKKQEVKRQGISLVNYVMEKV